MPHINEGRSVQEQNTNCAMCTLAAVVNHVTGRDADTRGIAGALNTGGNQDDAALAAALGAGALDGKDQNQAVLNGMIDFVERLCRHLGRPVRGVQAGFFEHFYSQGRAIGYMRSKPAGTVFAVWGAQGDMLGMNAHWNFATTVGPNRDVRFFDFQDNITDSTPAFESPAFIAPRPIRYQSDEYTDLIILSFEPI